MNAQIPSPEVLHSASDGVIRDSIKQKDAIKYWEFTNEALNKCGFPWDMGMTFDMLHEDFDSDRYKLFIFPALFAPDDEIKSKIADMRKKGKCMLYMHAPYYAADNGLSVESMKKYTDMEFEKLDLSDNTAELCFEGACGIYYGFDNRTIVGDIWQNKDEINRIKPVFTVTNADVILARFRENGLPAV